jgi:hypothetical protein
LLIPDSAVFGIIWLLLDERKAAAIVATIISGSPVVFYVFVVVAFIAACR